MIEQLVSEYINPFHKTCWRCNRIPITYNDRFHVIRKDGAFVASDLCDTCYNALIRSTADHRKRARKAGAEATLSVQQWIEMLRQSNGYCHYCKNHVGYLSLTLDHVIPIFGGGSTTPENVVTACKLCNTRKRTKDVEQWLVEVAI